MKSPTFLPAGLNVIVAILAAFLTKSAGATEAPVTVFPFDPQVKADIAEMQIGVPIGNNRKYVTATIPDEFKGLHFLRMEAKKNGNYRFQITIPLKATLLVVLRPTDGQELLTQGWSRSNQTITLSTGDQIAVYQKDLVPGDYSIVSTGNWPYALLTREAMQIATPTQIRTFTDVTGKLFKGELVSIDGANVTLKREDGQIFTLKTASFCNSDIEYFKSRGLKIATNEANVPASTPNPALTQAKVDFTNVVASARATFVKDLATAREFAMSAGDISEANAINSIAVSLAGGNVPSKVDFKSTRALRGWTVYLSTKEKARTQYTTILTTAQKAALSSGQLDEANRIDAEIKALTKGAPVTAMGEAIKSTPEGDAKFRFNGTKWERKRGTILVEVIEFRAGGVWKDATQGKIWDGYWKALGDDEVSAKRKGGVEWTLKLGDNGESLTRSSDGYKWNLVK